MGSWPVAVSTRDLETSGSTSSDKPTDYLLVSFILNCGSFLTKPVTNDSYSFIDNSDMLA